MSLRADLRPDLAVLSDWIPESARVLDLGCGDGSLLAHLAAARGVYGYGLEIDPDNVRACIEVGVNVIQSDLNEGLNDFDAQSFDVVLMTQALQALARPDVALSEMLRVGKTAIVTFPNFGHWRVRWALMFGGRMPVTAALPEKWFNTPNIHLCSVEDFEALAKARGWTIRRKLLLDRAHRSGRSIAFAPNLFAEIAIYELQGAA